MTSAGPTILSLAAAGSYGLVALACCGAAAAALSVPQRPGQGSGHSRGWIVLALFFGALIAARLVDAEQALAQDLRLWLRSQGAYAERRWFQGLIAAVIAGTAVIAGLAWLFRVGRHAQGQRALALAVAQCAGLAMACLIALRLVSFHAIDAVLYGPFKLNWFVDLGAAAIVAVSALIYIRAVRCKVRQGPRR